MLPPLASASFFAEANPRPMPRNLGGEKRFEQSLHGFGGDACAIILHGKDNLVLLLAGRMTRLPPSLQIPHGPGRHGGKVAGATCSRWIGSQKPLAGWQAG